jgi:Flp pilus assembly protein TadG
MTKNRRGQTALEVAALIPLFMMLAYTLLQLGYLGIGTAIVSYAASSVARQAVAENDFNKGDAQTKFNNLMMAGLKSTDIIGTKIADGDGTTNLRVTACAELPSFPLAGKVLAKAIKSTTPPGPDACSGATKWLGPIGLKGASASHFIIQGQAVVRMNYNVGK